MTIRTQHRSHHKSLAQKPGHAMGISASGYYSFATAMALTLFFVLWGVINDSDEETPWVSAGIAASAFFACTVIVREIVIRRRAERLAAAKKLLDRNIKFAVNSRQFDDRSKITLAQNNEFVAHIKMKSNAAKVLDNIPETHREVFELCDRYLAEIANERPRVSPGSPRIAAFRTGAAKVEKIHRYHVLRWAELESKQVAPIGVRGSIDDKLLSAARAADVLKTALGYYPDDGDLIASSMAVNEVLMRGAALDMVRRAESAAESGQNDAAIELFGDALRVLERSDPLNEQDELRSLIEERIRDLDPAASSMPIFRATESE